MPDMLTVEVVETGPSRGSGTGGATKPAFLAGGVRVLVPEYITTGERIVIRTETMEFNRRATD
ncbi:hypothetical protein H696_04363 [Fonticula alba]|uniref:Elongation factor P C-terminal domain-containing protein n=1 Tax=Fonticula alba TaxID=691883 RepID=A0A058Z3T8_FONAL|nr:hypothetical protein H696_04363 [Fonticula alba]KCV68944.1 hypothetical protein H696_04363 [Fonticula alba]|eukprot:XP_009496515.1 hypothetical protein H696_04363 [Fonticula alba]